MGMAIGAIGFYNQWIAILVAFIYGAYPRNYIKELKDDWPL
jgi:hypothetical protein